MKLEDLIKAYFNSKNGIPNTTTCNNALNEYCIIYYDSTKPNINNYYIQNLKFQTLSQCRNYLMNIVRKLLPLFKNSLKSKTTSSSSITCADLIRNIGLEYDNKYNFVSYTKGPNLDPFKLWFICHKNNIINQTYLPIVINKTSNNPAYDVGNKLNCPIFGACYGFFDSFLETNQKGNSFANSHSVLSTDTQLWDEINSRFNTLDERYILNEYGWNVNPNNVKNYKRLTRKQLVSFYTNHGGIAGGYDPIMTCDWYIEIKLFDGDYSYIEDNEILFEYNGNTYVFSSDFD